MKSHARRAVTFCFGASLAAHLGSESLDVTGDQALLLQQLLNVLKDIFCNSGKRGWNPSPFIQNCAKQALVMRVSGSR